MRAADQLADPDFVERVAIDYVVIQRAIEDGAQRRQIVANTLQRTIAIADPRTDLLRCQVPRSDISEFGLEVRLAAFSVATVRAVGVSSFDILEPVVEEFADRDGGNGMAEYSGAPGIGEVVGVAERLT